MSIVHRGLDSLVILLSIVLLQVSMVPLQTVSVRCASHFSQLIHVLHVSNYFEAFLVSVILCAEVEMGWPGANIHKNRFAI